MLINSLFALCTPVIGGARCENEIRLEVASHTKPAQIVKRKVIGDGRRVQIDNPWCRKDIGHRRAPSH